MKDQSSKRVAYRSRRVALPSEMGPATVVTEGPRIVEVLAYDADLDEDVRVEALGDLALLPGLVDSHVHINEPGRTEWEGFVTATRAAAAGGVTTVVDMPLNCLPVTTTVEALETKLDSTAGKLAIDVGYWGGVVPDAVEGLPALVRAGVLGCKAFLCDSGIPEFPESDEATLRLAMQKLVAVGAPLLAHAELCDEVHPVPAAGEGAPPNAYTTYLRSRPARWEVGAIELLIRLCRETGCAVHIVHLSAADALPAIAAAKAEGLPLTVETCPHYLLLAAESIPDGATAYKCAPPIREEANRERLWRALEDGTIDLVTTDHSPCTPALKKQETGDFIAAWGGISSLQLGWPLIWSEAERRGFELKDLVRWMSEAPARLAGLSNKGAIAVGSDADLAICDLEEEWVVTPDDLKFRHKLSPYIGRRLRGATRRTILRGAEVDEEAPRGRPLLGRSTEHA